MAKLKLLKMPKTPKLPKKPALSASLSVKQNWLKRVTELKANYTAKVREVNRENAKRISDNKKSDQLSKVIANTTSISKGSFRVPTRRKKSAASPKKKAGKRKAAPKKRTATRRRR